MKAIGLFSVVLLCSVQIFAQTFRVFGVVNDADTKIVLKDAIVYHKESGISSITNDNGQFSFQLSKVKNITLTIEKIGYITQRLQIHPTEKNTEVNVSLKSTVISFGEVTVSSTKSDQFLKETPLPIEVGNKEQIFNSTAIGISDALRNTPGITVARDGMWGTDINIRGLSRQNVVTLIDGNRIETTSNHAASLSLVDVMDIDKVEVIKGGISTLYGTGATGGVVSITSKKPGYSDGFLLKGSATSGFASANHEVANNLTLNASSETWFAKVAGTIRNADNVITPAGTLPNSYFHDQNYAAAFGIKPIDDHQLLLDFQGVHGTDIGIPGGKSFPQTDISRARYTKSDRLMYSAEYRINNLLPSLSNVSLKYFHQKITRDVEVKATPTQILAPGADHNTYGIQLLSNWVTGENSHLTAGVDDWQRSYAGHRTTTVIAGATTKITGDYPVPNSTYKSLGIYAQEDFAFFENKLKLNVGGRYDDINVSNDDTKNPIYTIVNGVRNDNPPINAATSFAASTHKDQSWSANFGALYSLTNALDATFNVSHAFRSPVMEERYQYINLGGDIYIGNPNLKPEVGNFLDLGLRLNNETYSAKVNIFSNYFSDLVVDSLIPSTSTIKTFMKANVGKAHLYGFDGSYEVNVVTQVVVYQMFSYVRGEDTQNHKNLAQIPPFNTKYGIKYHIHEIGTIDISAFTYSTQANTGSGELRTPGYTVFNMYLSTNRFSLSSANVKLGAGIENIFNKNYRDHLCTDRGLIKSEPGRNAFIKLELSW
jgi:hemoglobin/transferrin/lactoferrin receptor protein